MLLSSASPTKRPEPHGSRAAMSLPGEEMTREYAPSSRSMAAVTAASMEGLAQPLLDDQIGNDFRVCGGVEDGALLLQLVAQRHRVGEVAVVGQSHTPF